MDEVFSISDTRDCSGDVHLDRFKYGVLMVEERKDKNYHDELHLVIEKFAKIKELCDEIAEHITTMDIIYYKLLREKDAK